MSARVPVPIIAVHKSELVIVPPDLFEQVRLTLVSKATDGTEYANRRSHARNIKYLVSGIAVCGYCGRRLNLTSSHRRRRIGCTYHAGQTADCKHSGYAMHAVERLVIDGLRALVDEPSNLERFRIEAEAALAERESGTIEKRERLVTRRRTLQAKLDKALRVSLSHGKLGVHIEKVLGEWASNIEDLTSKIQALSAVAAPALDRNALKGLREMFDELMMRAPFVPRADAAEIAVFETIRSLIASIKLTRLHERRFEAIIEYDLGPALGMNSAVTRIVKTMLYEADTATEERRISRTAWIERLLAEGAWELTDHDYGILSAFPDFDRLFSDRPVDVRKQVLRVLLLRGAEHIPLSVMKKILGGDASLWETVEEFCAMRSLPLFVSIANRLFPDVPISRKALATQKRTQPEILRKLRARKEPFLRLAMCRSESGSTGIPDDHWNTIVRMRLGTSARKNSPNGRPYDERSADLTRRTLEALAAMVREDLSWAAAGERYSMTSNQLVLRFAGIKRSSRLKIISLKLLELEAADNAGGTPMSTRRHSLAQLASSGA